MKKTNLNRERELVIPPPALTGRDTAEVIRGWIVDGEWHFSLRIGDPTNLPEGAVLQCWGSLLAELTLHVAIALHRRVGSDVKETVRGLKEVYDSAMEETVFK